MLAINCKCLLNLNTHVISLHDVIQGFCYVKQDTTEPLEHSTAIQQTILSQLKYCHI